MCKNSFVNGENKYLFLLHYVEENCRDVSAIQRLRSRRFGNVWGHDFNDRYIHDLHAGFSLVFQQDFVNIIFDLNREFIGR